MYYIKVIRRLFTRKNSIKFRNINKKSKQIILKMYDIVLMLAPIDERSRGRKRLSPLHNQVNVQTYLYSHPGETIFSPI